MCVLFVATLQILFDNFSIIYAGKFKLIIDLTWQKINLISTLLKLAENYKITRWSFYYNKKKYIVWCLNKSKKFGSKNYKKKIKLKWVLESWVATTMNYDLNKLYTHMLYWFINYQLSLCSYVTASHDHQNVSKWLTFNF